MTTDPYATMAQPFTRHYATIRGQVRDVLAARQLAGHAPAAPALVADIGGGGGPQAFRLARDGYDVALLDPSVEMLAIARDGLAREHLAVRERVRLVEGYGEQASALLGRSVFDLVLCHGVIMYVDDPATLVAELGALAQPRGIVSVITKNAAALAMRPALEGRFDDALRGFDAVADVGGMGVLNSAHTLPHLERWLDAAGCDLLAWYGIRVLTDHLGARPPGPDMDQILAAEWEAGRRDPYRHVARLIHVIARKRDSAS